MLDEIGIEAIAKVTSAKPHKMACGVVRFFICLSFACCEARIADWNDMREWQESEPNLQLKNKWMSNP